VALLAPDLVPVSLLMLMIPLNVYVAWREWEALDRSGVTWTTLRTSPETQVISARQAVVMAVVWSWFARES
jgi:hypothetical protein